MNLTELKSKVDVCCSHCNPNEVEVLITLNQPSMGPRASAGVESVCLGFDWERNQLRIEPKGKLERSGLGRDVNRPKLLYTGTGSEVLNGYWCPRCQQKVDKHDKYCKHCGQRVEGEIPHDYKG